MSRLLTITLQQSVMAPILAPKFRKLGSYTKIQHKNQVKEIYNFEIGFVQHTVLFKIQFELYQSNST